MKILLLDDKASDIERARQAVREVIPEAEIFSTDDEETALDYTSKNSPNLVVLDIILKKEHGYAMCSKVLEINPNCNVILLTGSLNAIDSGLAERNGAYGFAIKTRNMASFKDLLKKIKKEFLVEA
jgi:DNA-binding NtrC family response regulator